MGELVELQTELDKLISRLSGVLAARTVVNDQNEIVEIHILSDMSKSPKQLVRDVQSAAMSVYGLDIDYKLISVAQVNSNMVVPAANQESRLQIRRITVSLDSFSVETTVTLELGDKQFEGSSRTPAGQPQSNPVGRSGLFGRDQAVSGTGIQHFITRAAAPRGSWYRLCHSEHHVHRSVPGSSALWYIGHHQPRYRSPIGCHGRIICTEQADCQTEKSNLIQQQTAGMLDVTHYTDVK